MLHNNVYVSAGGQITHKNLYDSAILFFRPAQVFRPKNNNFGDVEKMQLAESYIKICKIRPDSACGRVSSIWIINRQDDVKPWREYKMTRTYSRAESKPSEFFAVKGSKKRKKWFKLKFYC